MTHGSEPAAAQWWSVPPVGQVSFLAGVDPELLSIAFDPLPIDAPAFVRLRPARGGQLRHYIDIFLNALDHAAVALFPRWLAGAERLQESSLLGRAAVRALAEQAATRSSVFGPFLIDLAERSLSGHAAGRSPFPAEVRAAGLSRVLADAYERTSTVLSIEVPSDLPPGGERALVAAAELLVHHGRFSVWLVGEPLRVVDRIRSITVTLPDYLRDLSAETEPSVGTTGLTLSAAGAETTARGIGLPPSDAALVDAVALTFPPVSGLPRQDSAAERALERGLAPHAWALGRRWNHTYEWHLLGRPYRLDLFWPDDGLVVEVDGPEHRGRLKYADDRLRDVNLQLCGFDVLRFTNEQVLRDVQAVVLKIEQLLRRRRAVGALDLEMANHVEQ